ncbi:MAG: hypothetical protein ACYS83_08500 [Planctomycetota bacterium]|jgi:hypothetical protein
MRSAYFVKAQEHLERVLRWRSEFLGAGGDRRPTRPRDRVNSTSLPLRCPHYRTVFYRVFTRMAGGRTYNGSRCMMEFVCGVVIRR